MSFKFIILLVVLLLAPPIFAGNKILYYEPKIVTLSGIVKFETFPGPPNYDNIYEGDKAEAYPFLLLDHPIDVFLDQNFGDDDIDVPEKNVKIIQVVVTKNTSWTKLKSKKHICITGTLYHCNTIHHKSRVLISEQHTEYCSNTNKS